MSEIDDLRARIDIIEHTLESVGPKARSAHALAAANDREIADLQAQRQTDAHRLDERFEWLQAQLHESGRLHGETRADIMEIKNDVAALKSALGEILGLLRKP